MRYITLLIALLMITPAWAGGKTPGPDTTHENTKGKGHTDHKGNGYGHHKGDTNVPPNNGKPSKPNRPGRPGRPVGGAGGSASATQTQGQSQVQQQSQSNTQGQSQGQAAIGLGVGLGTGGSATGVGGTSNVSGGDVALDVVNDGGNSLYLGQVYRPNAILTPWCPQIIPAEAVQPVPSVRGEIPEERPATFWYGGIRFILAD